ncbi:MAG: tetratricopeptide repeat protein [Chloroflexi bacterium]|jgi:tetratricopeptide (TPR) repeat protein|nr:tetratricopeptide repeat protein [Chloroflexota bacterium]
MTTFDKAANVLFGAASPETVIVRLYSGTEPEERRDFLAQLSSILPYLNWRAHIYVVHDNPADQIDGSSEVIQIVAQYLAGQKLSTVYVHPCIHMQSSEQSETHEWERLLNLMQPFQREAYDQQSEVRMLILPIIEPESTTSIETILTAAEFFRSRLAKPSFYFHEKSPLDPVTVLQRDLRVYVYPSPDMIAEGTITQLCMNHIFEGILERVEEDRPDLFGHCRRHIIIDEKDTAFFACFSQWEKARPLESFQQLEELPEDVDCVSCISRSCLSMEENLEANAKTEEGRQVHLGLGIALSQKHLHKDAITHARKAFELSTNDADRAVALLHKGLCHLSLRELALADETLREGSTFAIDQGLFSYHRGTVQFARNNYMAAIKRFEEALATESTQVPKDDLLFNLALSYINLEEFSRARSHFALIEQMSAPVHFYHGICDLGEGMVALALNRFNEALNMGPAPDDLSRIHFYRGTCLKELNRYDEAIVELGRAVEADSQDYMNYNLLGFCFYQVKKHEEAIEVFHKAIEINPGSAIDYASIGSNLRELGRLEDAIAMYKMAISIDPTLDFAMENIARLNEIIEKRSAE